MMDRLIRALGLDRETRLIRRMRHDVPEKARAAILELGRLPCSDAVIHALEHSARTHWCVEALGGISDPRASAVLVDKLKRGGFDAEDAGIALRHARHDPAVPALEKLATGADDYHVVARSVKALEGIGTPAAGAALERFRFQPARPLKYYESVEYTLVDSRKLGQGVTPASRAAERAEALARDPVRQADDAQFAAMLARWRARPDSIVRERPGLVECMRAPAGHARRAAVAAALAGADRSAIARDLFDRLDDAHARMAFDLVADATADRTLFELCHAADRLTPAVLGGLELLARRQPSWAGPEITDRLERNPDGDPSDQLLRILPAGFPKALAPYMARLKDANWLVRRAAVEKLCRSATPDVRAVLEAHLAREGAVEVAHVIRQYLAR